MGRVAAIFQNNRKREGENGIPENVACWFLGVLHSNSQSKAGKQGVGTGVEIGVGNRSSKNNSVVAPGWETDR